MPTSKTSFTDPWRAKGYSIADLFPGSDQVFYRLPLAQRDYAWEDKNIDALLDPILLLAVKWEAAYKDLASKYVSAADLDPQLLVEEDAIDYYTIGTATFSVVASPNDISDKYPRSNPVLLDILDGQQRLTTITLVLLACWYLLDEHSHAMEDPKKANDLAHGLKSRLLSTDISRDLQHPRIFRQRDGVSEDVGHFIFAVLEGDTEEYTTHHLNDAFDRIVWSIRANCGLSQNEADNEKGLDLDFVNFVKTALYGVRCGALVAPPGKTTETFIVINRSGQELTEMDIIKCYILDLCQQNSDREKAAEKKFVELLSGSKPEEVMRIWIDSKHQLSRPADVKKLAENFAALELEASKTKAKEVLAELEEASDLYHSLKGGEVNGVANKALQMANSLSIHSAYSVILAAPDYAREEVTDIISRAVSIRKICGGKLMGAYHTSIYRLCGDMVDGAFEDEDGEFSSERFKDAVQQYLLGDFTRSDFTQKVAGLAYESSDSKTIMRVLYANISVLLNMGFRTPAPYSVKFSLDHFHPQNPRSDDTNDTFWGAAEDEALLHSIGNIAPMPQTLNNRLANQPITTRFKTIASNAGDGIAVAKFCCSGSEELPDYFRTGVTNYFGGNSHVADKVLDLLPKLKFSSKEWTPEMASARSQAIAQISLALLDPDEALLSATRSFHANPEHVRLFMASESGIFDAEMSAVWEDDELTEFLLLPGSSLRYELPPSAPETAVADRARLSSAGKVVEVNNQLLVQEPIPFDSCSAAANVVAGRKDSGPKSWVDKDGFSVAELEASRKQ